MRAIILSATAAFCHVPLAMAQGLDVCRPGCGASAGTAREEKSGSPVKDNRFLGINYAGTSITQIKHLQKDDLLGAMKMSGTWVSKLSFASFVKASNLFCRYAKERGQNAFLQIPLTFSDRQISVAFEGLLSSGCDLKGVAIGNEVDRLVAERVVARYTVSDYVADYNRIVPLVKKYFPAAKIIALELSSFAVPEFDRNDPVAVKYKPIFDWLIPFSNARLVRRPDYVSVHYYPFTGAQKEWETLAGGRMFREILEDLGPHLSGAPPLLIGEFNATYQYEGDTVYPDSGGDSFMAALTAPDLIADKRVAGVFHWSLVEPTSSSLGLYQGNDLAPVPLLHTYRMLASVLDHESAPARTNKSNIDASAYHSNGRYRILIVNTSPFFRRNISISGKIDAEIRVDFCGCEGPSESVTLPPLSFTALDGDLWKRGDRSVSQRFSYADRVVRAGDFLAAERSKHYCATLADFSQKNYSAVHFENAKFNQNAKIGTGGSFVALSSLGGRTSIRKEPGSLAVNCTLPGSGFAYYQCGVKLPFVPDLMADRRLGMDWTEGYEKGLFRVTLATDAPIAVEMHLEDFYPEVVGHNPHQTKVVVSGLRTLEVPLREFRQVPGVGVAAPLKSVLSNISNLRIEVRQPGFAGQLRIHKLEVCDFL